MLSRSHWNKRGIYSLVGPNGAGKITLFNLLKRTQGPDEGSITFGGQSINGLSPAETTQLAMALATDPELLLLDEPVAGMNSEERQEMLGTIERIQEAFDVTVLLIEHDMEFVVDLSDRIVVLNEGRKIADGEPEAVMTDDAVVRAYLGEGGLDA